MSLREVLALLSQHPLWLGLYFAAVPLVSLLCFFIPLTQRHKARYVYSCLTYLSILPGMFALVLIAYSLFFTGENLLDVNFLLYFLPVASMALSLTLMGKQIRFQDLPGFDRLAGLMILTGLSCLIALLLRRTFVGLFFGGGLMSLLILILLVFALFKWAFYSLTRGKREPRRKMSSFLD